MDENRWSPHRCFICGRPQDQVEIMIATGNGAFICSDCVDACSAIIYGEEEEQQRPAKQGKKAPEPLMELPTPTEMKAFLDQYVIGQEQAKKALCVAVYNHYKRVNLSAEKAQPGDVELQKSNVLLVGPTGSGKTFLAQTLAKLLKVPFAIADATTLTEAGYVGEDVENVLLRLYQAADQDITQCERGIIYIDEIDKIARKGENMSITRDVSGEGVQQALLKIIEGTQASVPPTGGRKHPQQEMIQINTSNILFICGGAFDGIIPIIERRVGKKMLGFGAELQTARSSDHTEALRNIRPEDLTQYGLIPEFVGRLPILVTLDALDEDDMLRILTEPKNALCRQYQKLLDVDGVKLRFTDEALRAIAHEAIARKTGARGLRAIIEDVMLDTMYELPARKDVAECVVDEEAVHGGKPELLTDPLAKGA